MENKTLYLPGFHLETLRRTPRSARQVLADKAAEIKNKSFGQLSECFAQFIPRQHLQPAQSGVLSRRRFFSKENTFWAFFSQVLDADGGCQEVVRKLQAFDAMQSKTLPSSSTAGYCQARKNLDRESLQAIFQHTVKQLQATPDKSVLHGGRGWNRRQYAGHCPKPGSMAPTKTPETRLRVSSSRYLRLLLFANGCITELRNRQQEE